MIDRLRRTTDTIVGEADLRTRLESGWPLRIKYGVDCTAPDLHLGHAVNLWMMRGLQDLGHRVVFLLSDVTTRIGDPTGRSETRPLLTPDEIEANATAFLAQVSLVLRTDPEVFEVRRNSEWYDAMDVATLLGLFAHVTQAQLMAREVITSTITPGLDGGPKQSKSLNNSIALTDSPQDKLVETYARTRPSRSGPVPSYGQPNGTGTGSGTRRRPRVCPAIGELKLVSRRRANAGGRSLCRRT